MEISFEGREAVVYREFAYQTRRTQETAECVVPDTDADIQKIAAVQSGVLLKSKDLSSRGVTVSGSCTRVSCTSARGSPASGASASASPSRWNTSSRAWSPRAWPR